MALFPRQGLGAALQEASPLLLGLSQGLLSGNYGGGLAMGVQGLQQKTQEREGNELFQGLFTQPTLSTMNAQPQGGGLLGTPAVSGGVGYSGQPQSANAGSADRIRMGLIQRGLPAHVADGFVMNFQDESGLNPGINEQKPTVPGSRGGFGLAQWTGPRRVALERAAQQRGVSPADVDLQLDFLMGELQGDESRAARSILATEDAGTAAAAVARDFLRPAQQHLDRRVANYTGGGGSMSTMGGGNVQSGPDLNRMYMALASGRLNPNQAAVVQAMIGQTLQTQQAQQKAMQQANDPLRRVQLETAQEQLNQLRNPPPASPTDRQQNYQFLLAQGIPQDQALAKAFGQGGTTVNVGGATGPELGKLSTDYGYVIDPSTGQVAIDQATGLPRAAPVPGSPAAREIEAQATQAQMQGDLTDRSANIVMTDIDRALGQINANGTTGFVGNFLSGIPGTAANDLRNTLLTVQGNVGFDRLQQMREASPTGGALGAISDRELATLQAVMGALGQDQSQEQIRANLDRLKTIYTGILEKANAYPNASQFGFGGGSMPARTDDPRPNPPSAPTAPVAPTQWRIIE